MHHRAIAVAFALLAALSTGHAVVCTATVGVLTFGIYDTVQATPNDTTGTVQVTCIPGVAQPLTTGYTITVAGTGTGNDSVRSVVAGTYRLYYQLYKDVAHTAVWGNGVSATGVSSSVTSTAVLVPALKTHTVYARMNALQVVPPALYTGSLLVTVDY